MEWGPSFQLEVPRAQGRAVRPPRDEALRASRGRQGGSCGGLAARSNGSRCWSATARPPAPCPTSSWATHTPSGSSRKTCVDSAPRPPSPRSSRTSRRQVGVGPGRAPSAPARRVLAPRAPPRPPLPDRHVGADPSRRQLPREAVRLSRRRCVAADSTAVTGAQGRCPKGAGLQGSAHGQRTVGSGSVTPQRRASGARPPRRATARPVPPVTPPPCTATPREPRSLSCAERGSRACLKGQE